MIITYRKTRWAIAVEINRARDEVSTFRRGKVLSKKDCFEVAGDSIAKYAFQS